MSEEPLPPEKNEPHPEDSAGQTGEAGPAGAALPPSDKPTRFAGRSEPIQLPETPPPPETRIEEVQPEEKPMAETFTTPPLPPVDTPAALPPARDNRRTWIIVIVVLLVLCCCCVVLPVIAFLTGLVPVDTNWEWNFDTFTPLLQLI